MKMKVLFSAVMVVLLSLGFSSESSAQWHRPHYGHHYRSGGYHNSSSRVVIAVRPPIRHYDYRVYPRYRHYRHRNRCVNGHYRCNDRSCYNGGSYRQKNYDRYDDRDGYNNNYRERRYAH